MRLAILSSLAILFALVLVVTAPSAAAQTTDDVAASAVASKPQLLHGFDLAPFRQQLSWDELKDTTPIFDRSRSMTRGGAWRCSVDSATKYHQWTVYYAPIERLFYVHDTQQGIVYGPIAGDAIEKLKLLDGTSDLKNMDSDVQNQQRAAGEKRVRIEKLLSSGIPSLNQHALAALLTLGDLTILDQRRWRKLVQPLAKISPNDDKYQSLVAAAIGYLDQQHARTESIKVDLPASDYQPGREPTPVELELQWGPVTEGLSLAVDNWPRTVRQFTVDDRATITYLVRNVSDSAKRISTLNVLDGVGADLTDESTNFSALLTFAGTSGWPRTERYLLEPEQVVAVKKFSFAIKDDDLHPLHKEFKPGSRQFMYGHLKLRANRIFRIDFYLNMPSAYSGESTGKINLPAKGEFDGKLTAPPLRLCLVSDEKKAELADFTDPIQRTIDGDDPVKKSRQSQSKSGAAADRSRNRRK